MHGRESRKRPTHIFPGVRPHNPVLPKGYEAYNAEQMLGMLDSALVNAGYKFDDKSQVILDKAFSVHSELLQCLDLGDFVAADAHVGFLLQSNMLVQMAQALICAKYECHMTKYAVEPDRDFCEQAEQLLNASKRIAADTLFYQVFGCLKDKGYASTVDDIMGLLGSFKTPDFVAFLLERVVNLAPQPEPEDQSKSVVRFFKPEMMYLDELDAIPFVANYPAEPKMPKSQHTAPAYEKDYEEFSRPLSPLSQSK